MNYSYPESIHDTVIDYTLNDGDVVLDVGGYEGAWTAALLKRNKNARCQVFVFEPVEEFYDIARLRLGEFPNVTVLNVALSDCTRQAKATVCGCGSHIADSGVEIKTLDVADFFRKYEISTVALASINIEGHEFVLLPRLIETGLITKIEKLQVQFHSEYPDSDARRNKIREQLALTHTEVYCYPFVWETWRRK